jgi:hypothetical protein
LRAHLVLRAPDEESAEFPKKLRPLSAELVLRYVPRKSVQRWRPAAVISLLGRRALDESAGQEVIGIGSGPRRLRATVTLALAFAR